MQGGFCRQTTFCATSAVIPGHLRNLGRRRMACSADRAIVSGQRCFMSGRKGHVLYIVLGLQSCVDHWLPRYTLSATVLVERDAM